MSPESQGFNILHWLMGIGSTLIGGIALMFSKKINEFPEKYVSKIDHNRSVDLIRADMNKGLDKIALSVSKVHGRVDDVYTEMPKRSND